MNIDEIMLLSEPISDETAYQLRNALKVILEIVQDNYGSQILNHLKIYYGKKTIDEEKHLAWEEQEAPE